VKSASKERYCSTSRSTTRVVCFKKIQKHITGTKTSREPLRLWNGSANVVIRRILMLSRYCNIQGNIRTSRRQERGAQRDKKVLAGWGRSGRALSRRTGGLGAATGYVWFEEGLFSPSQNFGGDCWLVYYLRRTTRSSVRFSRHDQSRPSRALGLAIICVDF
jgi:hypothetical protein